MRHSYGCDTLPGSIGFIDCLTRKELAYLSAFKEDSQLVMIALS